MAHVACSRTPAGRLLETRHTAAALAAKGKKVHLGTEKTNARLASDFWKRGTGFIAPWADWTIPAKMALGALLGLFAGPGLLGYVSEYATYCFALYEGIRPPLEGIPYLQTAVTTVSFILAMISAIAFILALLITRFVIWQLKFVFRLLFRETRLNNLAFTNALFIGGGVGIVMFYYGIFAYVVIRLLWDFFEWQVEILTAISTKKLVQIHGSLQLLDVLKVLFFKIVVPIDFIKDLFQHRMSHFWFGLGAAPVLGIILTLLLWSAQAAWWTAALTTVALFFAALVTMFNHEYYGFFLRYLRYGGGIPMIVEFNEPDHPGAEYSANLVLRTSAALLMFDPAANIIREIPIGNVKSLKLPAGSLHETSYVLPSMRSPTPARQP